VSVNSAVLHVKPFALFVQYSIARTAVALHLSFGTYCVQRCVPLCFCRLCVLVLLVTPKVRLKPSCVAARSCHPSFLRLIACRPRLRAAVGAAGAAAVPQQRVLGLHRRHTAAAARTGAGVLPASQPAGGAQRSAGQVGV
jgi:hypothetical protein